MLNIIGTSILYLLIGYLLGSISFSILLVKWFKHTDIRTLGSKNAGSTNVTRNFGSKIGVIVAILDIGKVLIAIGICQGLRSISGDFSEGWIQLAGLGAIVGHAFPVFFKFKGGKSMACLSGFLLYMNWALLFISLIGFILLIKHYKKVAMGSIICPSLVIPFLIVLGILLNENQIWLTVFNGFVGYPWWIGFTIYIIAYILVIALHHNNIKQIIAAKRAKII